MNVFIGCSSSSSLDNIYYDNARLVANFLASIGFDLLTGGESGMMGVIQEEFVKYKRNISIMEALCYKKDFYKYKVYNYKYLYSRKWALINKASLIVFLPGGIGTFDEIFTAIESRRALEHNKNIIILNFNGYYDDLLKVFNTMYERGFASIDNKKCYSVIDNFSDFKNYVNDMKWCDSDD